MEKKQEKDHEEIYSNAVRAGKRTYFFDVRETKGKDYYLTITESKRKYHDDGSYEYKKHKIFLYKEDFEKFSEALGDAFKKVIDLKHEQEKESSDRISQKFTELSFEELS